MSAQKPWRRPTGPELVNDGKHLYIYPGAQWVDRDVDWYLDESLKCDLSKVELLLFDPVPLCNVECPFCPVRKDRKYRSLNIEKFKLILDRISGSCKRIAVGCKYEPLIARNFSEFGDVLTHYIRNKFSQETEIYIVTNGTLLHKRSLEPYLEFLDHIHISVASQKKDILERLEKGANFKRLERNLKDLRRKYNSFRMHAENIVTKQNCDDIRGYISWVFDEIGFDTLHVRRVTVDMMWEPLSPLARSLEAGTPLALDDQEWERVVKEARSCDDRGLGIMVDNESTKVQRDKPPISMVRIWRIKS